MSKAFTSLLFFILLIISFTSAQTTTLNQGLISYWNFEETGGAVVDRVNGIHNGTNNGATTQSIGIIGNSYDFDGIGDYIEVAHHPNFEFGTNDFTISGWYKTNNINTPTGPIGKLSAGTSGWEINFGVSPGKISYYLPGTSHVQSTNNFNPNIWHYVVLIIDQPNEVKLYVDGNLEASSYVAGIGSLSTNAFLTIGSPYYLPPTGNGFFNGRIDEIGIWNRALSAQEVSALYNNGSGLSYNNIFVAPPAPSAPPTLALVGPQQTLENQTLTIQLQATDPNINDTLVFLTNAQSELPSPSFLNSTSGLFTWTPTFQDHGIYNVTFYVTDGQFIDSETIQITVQDVSFAVINLVGSTVMSNAVTFYLSDPEHPNAQYRFAGSLGSIPGIPLPDGRIIPLNDDWLLNAILYVPQLFGLFDTSGTLDSQGNAQVTWQIPTIQGAQGANLAFSFITIDPTQSGFNLISSISPAINVTLQ